MFVLNVIGKGAEPGIFRGLGRAGKNPVARHGVRCAGGDSDALAAARDRCTGLAIDINLLPAGNRKKKLLVADMDSTIINVECLDELADMAGLKPQIAAITERAMRGELEFETALKERVGMLKGLTLDALERTYVERVRLNRRRKIPAGHHARQRGAYHAGVRRVRVFHPARGGGRRFPCRARQQL